MILFLMKTMVRSENEDDDNKEDSGSGGGNRDTIPRYQGH